MPEDFISRKVKSSEELKFRQTILFSHITALTNEVMKWMFELSISPVCVCACILSFSKACWNMELWHLGYTVLIFLTFILTSKLNTNLILNIKPSSSSTYQHFSLPFLLQTSLANAASAKWEILPWIFLENELSCLNSLSLQKYVKKQRLKEISTHWASHWRVNHRTFFLKQEGLKLGSGLEPKELWVSLPTLLSILEFFPSSFFSIVFMRFLWNPSSFFPYPPSCSNCFLLLQWLPPDFSWLSLWVHLHGWSYCPSSHLSVTCYSPLPNPDHESRAKAGTRQ